jgi:hypothetical protein
VIHNKTLDGECQCRHVESFPTIHSGSTCGIFSTIRGPKQKLFSFALYFEGKEACFNLNHVVRNRCLIHNAHLEIILSFCEVLDLRITRFRDMFDYYFHLISTIVFLAWPSNKKKLLFSAQNCVSKRKFLKLASETLISFVNEKQAFFGRGLYAQICISRLIMKYINQQLLSGY